MADAGKVMSLGQGARTIDAFLAELRGHGCTYLIDVRSVPRSSFRPEFSRDQLEGALTGGDLRYVFMGDLLGGRPDDPSCYIDGHVDYTRCQQRPFFQRGIARLKAAHEQGLTVCLMCSEGDPSQCHRSKLIGVALAAIGIEVEHIQPAGGIATQAQVIAEITGGQSSLFGEQFQSRRAYAK